MEDKQYQNSTDPNQTPTDTNGASPAENTATAPETTAEPAVATETHSTPTSTDGTPAGATAVTDEEPSNMTALIIGAIVVALLAIGGAWFMMTDDGMSVTEESPQAGLDGTAQFDEGDPDEIVATVNGSELTRADFNRIRQQVLQTAQQQGMDLSDPATVQQVNDQAMETLVNTELIRQAAVAAGITVTGEEVDARFAEVVQSVGGPEALAESLQQLGLTEESLRGDVEQELIVQRYLEQSIDADFTVSDEDVQAFYDQQGGAEALPPLDDVRAQIEQQLVMMEEQQVIEGILQELRADAEVETML